MEENLKKYSKNKIYYEKKEEEGFSFDLYRLTYNKERFLKKSKKFAKKVKKPFFIEGKGLRDDLLENYKKILDLNLFVFLAKQRKIKCATVFDPKGNLCFKIDEAIKNLKSTKIITENLALYEEYGEKLLSLYGVCPTIAESKNEQDFYIIETKSGKKITLGGDGFRSEIGSVICHAAESLCPKISLKEEFFTILALLGGCEPLLRAIPQSLILNGNSLTTDSIF